MSNPINTSASLAADTRGIETLRQSARQNSPEALKETAKQFEALFMNMIMKSMRDATASQEGVFDNQQSKMYTAMLDQQLSQNLASKGVGLADVLVRQLSGSLGAQPAAGAPPGQLPALPDAQAGKANPNPWLPPSPVSGRTGNQPAHVQAFQQRVAAHAEEASLSTGIPAKFMMGQAALESGWGKREIRGTDGSPSHNLFGIKAGPGWKGKVVEAVTTEYVNGVPQRRTEKFRAYDSYADSFRDYAKLLRNNPRYENVIANARDVN
ncbi:MAG: flgJ, partial [Noviherbaspirillum sp.]|nr:flgJ [Noviherbaspirillum sp.]